MKLKDMGFETELLIKNPDEKIEIDYIRERIQFSKKNYYDLKTITGLQRFQMGYSKNKHSSPKLFNVMAIKLEREDDDTWLFVCDSKKRFRRIEKEFMKSYGLKVTVTKTQDFSFSTEKKKVSEPGKKGYNAKRFFKEAVKVYDARREFLKFLLDVGREERIDSSYHVFRAYENDGYEIKNEPRITGCKFDLPDDIACCSSKVGTCLIIDESDFDTLFKGLSRLLPENKKVTQIEAEYGEGFTKKEEVLEDYRQSVSTEDILSQRQEIQAEIDCWNERIKNKPVEEEFGKTYMAILREKMGILENKAYMEAKKKGEIGEKEVDYALKWLNKSYRMVPKVLDEKHGDENIKLFNPKFMDEPQEYDHIVIGKQGVFVIETKNYQGTISIDSDGNWIRTKEDGRREGARNPYQQVDRHIKLLKSFLKEGIPVIGVICIAHPGAIIEGAGNSPIRLVKSDLLAKCIEDYPLNGRALSDEEIQECLSLIEKHRL